MVNGEACFVPELPVREESGQRGQIMPEQPYVTAVLCVGNRRQNLLGRQNSLGKFKVVTGDHSKHGPEDDVECGRSAAHKGGEKAASVCVRVIADHVIWDWHTTHDLPDIKKKFA